MKIPPLPYLGVGNIVQLWLFFIAVLLIHHEGVASDSSGKESCCAVFNKKDLTRRGQRAINPSRTPSVDSFSMDSSATAIHSLAGKTEALLQGFPLKSVKRPSIVNAYEFKTINEYQALYHFSFECSDWLVPHNICASLYTIVKTLELQSYGLEDPTSAHYRKIKIQKQGDDTPLDMKVYFWRVLRCSQHSDVSSYIISIKADGPDSGQEYRMRALVSNDDEGTQKIERFSRTAASLRGYKEQLPDVVSPSYFQAKHSPRFLLLPQYFNTLEQLVIAVNASPENKRKILGAEHDFISLNFTNEDLIKLCISLVRCLNQINTEQYFFEREPATSYFSFISGLYLVFTEPEELMTEQDLTSSVHQTSPLEERIVLPQEQVLWLGQVFALLAGVQQIYQHQLYRNQERGDKYIECYEVKENAQKMNEMKVMVTEYLDSKWSRWKKHKPSLKSNLPKTIDDRASPALNLLMLCTCMLRENPANRPDLAQVHNHLIKIAAQKGITLEVER